MNYAKRIFSLLLAALLCLCAATAAYAEELQTGPESSLTEDSEQEAGPAEETPVEEAPTEGTPAEEAPAEALESTPTSLAAASLLVTGGHNPYMSGYKGAQFRPDQVMTRAEAAQMLYNLLAAKPPVSESAFSDVKLTDWFGVAVNALNQASVISGYTDGTFAPNSNISRAEFVTALTKCFSLPAGTASFSDVPETSWAYPFISSATSQGWISGVGNNTFEPNRGIKRSEAVAVMNAALERTGEGFAADRDVQKFRDVPKTHWAFQHITEAAQPIDEAEPEPEPEPGEDFQVGQTVIVTADGGLNLRSQPTTASASLTTLTSGTTLTVTSVSELPWLGVNAPNNRSGYVHSDYVDLYVPGQASGAKVSASRLSLHQYQSARLDGSITSGKLSDMDWTSSDPDVAVVGYAVNYKGTSTQGAIVYGKKPGTTTLTFMSKDGKSKASCSVTVTAPQGVRYGYASINSVVAGQSFDLTAIAESSKTQVTFTVTGPAAGTYVATEYTDERHSSSHGLPENRVRVFKKNVTFDLAGVYTVRAQANNASDVCTFSVFVGTSASPSQAISGDHRTSNEMLRCISRFEGSVREIADDDIAAGNPTVGYGYVVPKNTAFYNNLTDSELWAMLVDEVNSGGYGSAVNSFRARNNMKINQAQYDALVSFVYNLGTGTLSSKWGFCRVMLNAVAPPQASEASPVSGTLNVEDANLLEQPNPTAKKVVTVPNGSTVSIIGSRTFPETKQIWYQVIYDGKRGWMPAGYIQTSTSNRDLTYADSTVLANHILQWCTASGSVWPGLVYRRQAECKVFFFADYEEAYHYNDAAGKGNTYHFVFPDVCKDYE